MCASFEVLWCVHPSRCFDVCILRDDLMCASFEMLWWVHPSRCFVLILRDVLICASFEVLCYTWLKRFLYSSALLVVLGPEELSARGIYEKRLPPFLALGSLVSLFRRFGVCAFGALVLCWSWFIRVTSCCHKRQCVQILLEKCLPPYLRGVVSLVCRMTDAEGSERKNVSPLSGIRLSILSSCFFAVGFFGSDHL